MSHCRNLCIFEIIEVRISKSDNLGTRFFKIQNQQENRAASVDGLQSSTKLDLFIR